MGFAIESSSEISHRVDFALLSNARGHKVAVEVGVDLGVNARDFLSRWNGHWLIGVDPYEPHGDIPDTDRAPDILTAVQALLPWQGRFRLLKARSVDVARHWPKWIGRPGFVYLDGLHTEDGVRADLEAWWQVLEGEAAIIGGHDFDNRHEGVIAAVQRFARDRGLCVRLTHEAAESETKSWYVYRTEPTRLVHKLFKDGESPNPHAAGGT